MIQSDFVPEDYFAVVATYGPNSPDNAVGFREHPQRQYQGLRVIPGAMSDYPIQDAFYSRAFGVGVRRRGQACITQIKATGTYDVPEIPK